MRNIKHLLDTVDKVRDHMALGLMSDPGLSKTSQVKQWAEQNGRQYCELIISQRMPSEISGMPMPIPEKQTMEIFDFDTLLHLKDGDVLAFDEFTNGNIQTLNACLTLIQERVMLSGKPLPSLLIVAMGNPQGKCDLLPQTKQRFWWVNVTWDAGTWKNYMAAKWGVHMTNRVLQYITSQYQDGFADPYRYNYITPRTMENLYRVALETDMTDMFWSLGDLPSGLVEALYECVSIKDPFFALRDELRGWVLKQTMHEIVGSEEIVDYTSVILPELEACTSMRELKILISRLEEENLAPEFIKYMKQTDIPDE